ncbi:choice-of-anchor D domain-containing protein [Nitratireductor sp. ZSWI3]|uniref:DUF7507 domain-containing protein n=1 Tax=Nitratireductor sp. ZSWI3 TaxID=2966359 RepID=UPI00214FBA16|nr:choice-of-anchor D domain-containing protein [Nitratireductor sp. ZSWI3]MCR4265850.1 choice-of-anchor D domain-containing protein [Nitratireductor sp. ZSWI3]
MTLATGAQAQVVFNEDFGTTNSHMPTAQSTADGPWLLAECLNGFITLNTGISPTHFLHHNTQLGASCTYAPGQAVWRNINPIPVEPNRTYTFSYRVRDLNGISPPVLSQTIATNAGGSTVLQGSSQPALVVGGWVTRSITFSTGAGTTSVALEIENANTAVGGNDFLLDDIVLEGWEADLSVTKDDGQEQYTPGGTVNYTIVVSNAGPESVVGASISDPLPSGISTASWTCDGVTNGAVCGAASGTGGISTTADLPAGSSVTYTLSMTVPVGFGGNLTNTATVATPGSMPDSNSSNNTASDTNTQFVFPPDPTPNACNIATNGSFESPNIQTEPQRPGENTSYINGYAIWRTTTYPLDGWETVSGTVDLLRYHSNASEGMQSIDLWGTAPATLRQTFTGLVPGQQYTFSIDYAGQSSTQSIASVQLGNGSGVTPVTIATLQPVANSVLNGGSGLPTTPYYSQTWATYQYTFVAAGTEATVQFVNNTAPGPGNTGLFIDNFVFAGNAPCEADLSITKDNGETAYTPGLDTNYTIVVTNAGPGPVGAAQISDPLPFGVTEASWTCGGEVGGAVCGAPSGTGAIDTTANLPAGASVTYTLNMMVPASFSGSLTNTATVTPPNGVTDTDTSNNTASDTDTQESPPTSGACSPLTVEPGASFTLAPFPVTGTVTKTAGAWQTDNPWATQGGGDYTIRWTFSQPVPASWLRFVVVDVNEPGTSDYTAVPPTFTVSLGAGSTATTADFSLIQGDLTYSGGALRYNPSGPYRQSGYLQGTSTNTVTSITVTSSGVGNGDNIANPLFVRPACLTVSKVSEGGTDTFQFDLSNVMQADGTGVPSTSLTTTTAGTSVSSAIYNSVPGTDIVLSEVVPDGWFAASAACTDQNAGNTGNPTSVGTFVSPDMTIDGTNVRPESDLQCTFTNNDELPPFAGCDATMYLAQGNPTRLYQFDTSSNPFVVTPVGQAWTGNYNAIAYNPVDNYIYGLSGPAPGRLVRVGSDGSAMSLGTIANFPTNSVAGEIGPDGTYYVVTSTTLYVIDIATMTASPRSLSQTIAGQDLAWHDGRLWIAGPNNGPLYEINPANGVVTPHGATGVAGAFGGMFGATNGVFGSNNDGGFYRFDLATGRATLISDLQGSSSNDGAKCVNTPMTFPADTAITKTDDSDTYAAGTDVTYTLVVSNNGPFGVQNALVNDPLPASIADATWTCDTPVNGGVCEVASGTGAIVDAPVSLPVGGSVTFTLIMSVPDDFTGDLVNTATVANPADVPDPDLDNNTATDTDVTAAPGLTIEKTGTLNDLDGDNLIDAGETISYSFLVTNSGNVTLTDVTVDDPLLTNAGVSLDQGPQTLAPGGSFTFTATYQPTQADIDAGQVENTATGTGTPPNPDDPPVESPPDTVTVPPDDEPGMTIDKTGTLNDLDGDSLIDPGETITYSFVVRNTGNVTLTGVTVNDPLLVNAGVSLDQGPQTLAPGGSFTFTATYQPTQAEIDAGSVENTATGIGTPPDPNEPPIESPPDTVVVPPDDTPGLVIDKTGTLNDLDGDNLIDPGETITYSFLARNTGNVTLTGVTVNDPMLTNAGVSLDQGPQTLAPGGSFTFTATYQPTQADIDAGRVENTATGTGTPPSGPPIESPPDTVVVPPDDTPGMTIDKTGTLNDLDGDGLIDPGETITYSFVVRNTGNVTLTDVTVNDPLLTNAGVSLDQGPQTLAPGGSFTFTATYQPTQTDIDAGQVENTATGTGTPPDPNEPPVESPPDTVVVPPDDTSGMTIDKTGTLNDLDSDGLIDLGESIDYTFVVTNTGNVTLTNVTVNDPLLTNAGISLDQGPQTLAPGGTFTFTATYQPTQADIDAGQVENTATGTGTPPDPNEPPVESPPDTVVVPPDDTPGMTIDKTGTLNDLDGDNLIDLGESISYSFLVRNTGNVTLTGVTVNDPLLTNAGISVTPGPQTLAPGGAVTFTATYQPTQADIDAGRVENTATGTGTPPSGPPIESPPDTVVVPPDDTPGMTIDKTGTLNDLDGDGLIDPGESISYSFVVRNTGNVTLTGVTVNDPLLANAGISVTPGPQTLAPGGAVTFTATYQPTQADIDAGRVENTATGTGTPPDPNEPPVESPPDTVVVPPDDTPGMTIDKTGTLNDLDGDGLIDPGESISYAFVVRNTGNVTLTGVTVNDPLLANAGISVTPGPQTLAPGGAVTFTATYQPTQADIDAGRVENTATGTGTPPDPNEPPVESPPDTVVVPPDDTPGMTIDKTGTLNDLDGDGLIDPGESISYSFVVRNTGNVTLTNVTVDDPLLTNAGISVTPGPQTLAPGGAVTFTATYQPTQADIDAGRVENTATGTGTPPDPNEPPVESPPDTVVVPPDNTPGMTVDKTGTVNDLDGDGLFDLGETIGYSFLVTNTGNVTLTGVTVNDPLLTDAGVSLDQGPQTLAPGDSFTFTATFQPTQADIDAGSVENTATGTGTPPDPNDPPIESPPDTVTTQLPRADLAIEKTGVFNDVDGNGIANVGDRLDYTLTITNTGNLRLQDVSPQDPGPTFNGRSGEGTLSAFTPDAATLEPGETQVFTATYALFQGDVDNGVGVDDGVENTATATGFANGTRVTGTPVESNESVSVLALPAPVSDITVTKVANLRFIRRGEQAPFTIKVTNNGASLASGITVIDTMPSGFRYVEGSATVDGTEATPEIVGRQIRFSNLSVPGNGGMLEIRLRLLALSSAGPGEHVNLASVIGPDGEELSPSARAVVEIIVEPVFDCGDIIGKVFDDRNGNGYQDKGEPGLPGVRIATVKGWLITTDKYGRFHVACADLPDQRIGTNFIMKLDTRTLPTGYRLTTENPRVVRLTAGKMTELNFGASIGRVVRLDLRDEAFAPGKVELSTVWAAGVDQLIEVLAQQRSVLRLSYIDSSSDPELATARIRHMKKLIADRWRQRKREYPLNIETRVETGQ